MENKTWPEWANQEDADKYGNVTCKVCGKAQSPYFRACIYCCNHDELTLTEKWHGSDEYGDWGLDVECSICWKNYDFSNKDLIQKYKLVRK